jgi:8-oxo-dGTP pyrophosphatase MutT (NUDIX family)
MTGVDQLLVFDFPGDPDYQSIVPGGGIERGETPAEAARREALEETGIAVQVVREVGAIPGSHFFQAAPLVSTRDEWEHTKTPGDELVHCRWLTLQAGLDVWGERGAFIDALIRRRVVAYATRERGGRAELLTIEHVEYPEVGIQVPAGRVDHDEDLEDGCAASSPRRQASGTCISSASCRTSNAPMRPSLETTPSTSSSTRLRVTSGSTVWAARATTPGSSTSAAGCRSRRTSTSGTREIRCCGTCR